MGMEIKMTKKLIEKKTDTSLPHREKETHTQWSSSWTLTLKPSSRWAVLCNIHASGPLISQSRSPIRLAASSPSLSCFTSLVWLHTYIHTYIPHWGWGMESDFALHLYKDTNESGKPQQSLFTHCSVRNVGLRNWNFVQCVKDRDWMPHLKNKGKQKRKQFTSITARALKYALFKTEYKVIFLSPYTDHLYLGYFVIG